MTLIPTDTVYSLKKGVNGMAVFALQRAANRLGLSGADGKPLKEDGSFGDNTEYAAIQLQKKLGVTPDGKFGPVSQATLARYLCDRREVIESNAGRYIPNDYLISLVDYESSGYLGCVNWNVPGGVDCGITQRRVYEADYENDALVQACFDPISQIGQSAVEFNTVYKTLVNSPGINGKTELAVRSTALKHNYPAAVDRISKYGLVGLTGSSYYMSPAAWVKAVGIKFPDGTPIQTPYQWCQRYALGAPDHNEPGQAVKFVKFS